MKIIVNNEEEKELINKFISCTEYSGLDFISEYFDKEGVVTDLTCEDLDFLSKGLQEAKIDIDRKQCPMEYEDCIIEGNCSKCGCYLEGTPDGGDVTYEEYRQYVKDVGKGNFMCESCSEKE